MPPSKRSASCRKYWVDLLIDASVLGVFIVIADAIPLGYKLAVLALLVTIAIVFYLLWNNRP